MNIAEAEHSTIGLSFCIPTFNNGESLLRLVKDILSCDASEIEIVVLDNGSTDDTLSRLADISDRRLSVFSNGVNKGALFNMVNVLTKGTGRYLVYMTDHDHVDPYMICNFLCTLDENDDIVCGYCDDKKSGSHSVVKFNCGLSAVSNVAYDSRHPTGYFFKKKYLDEINLVERFSDYEVVDLFPLEFVFAELSIEGCAAIYVRPLFFPERGSGRVRSHKSATTDGSSSSAFFGPESRLKVSINFSKHLKTLDMLEHEKIAVLRDIYFRGLLSATFGYRDILKNNDLCVHYKMEPRELGVRELCLNGLLFHKKYIKGVFFKDDGFSLKFRFYLSVYYRILKKLMKKLVRKKKEQ